MHHPTDRITHTTAFVTPVVGHWLEREIAQWVHPMKDRSDDPSHHERTLLPRSYISLPNNNRLYFITSFFTSNYISIFVPLASWFRRFVVCSLQSVETKRHGVKSIFLLHDRRRFNRWNKCVECVIKSY